MDIKQVYNAINSEFDYIDNIWKDQKCETHSVAEYLVFIERYIDEAKKSCSSYLSLKCDRDRRALVHVRRIAAFAVSCLEKYGVEPYGNPEESALAQQRCGYIE